MKTLLLVVALLSVGTGCVHAPSTASPQAQQAFAAEQVVTRIHEFQSLVIDLSTSGQIPQPTARLIVSWTVRAVTVIGTYPDGWRPLVKETWLVVREEVQKVPQIAPWVGVIDIIVGVTT